MPARTLPSLQSHRRRYCGSCGSADLLHIPCSDAGLGWTECLDCEWTRNHTSTAHHCHDCGWAKPPGAMDHARVIGSGLPRKLELGPLLEERRRQIPAWAPTQPQRPALLEEAQQGCPRASRLVVGIALAGLAALLGLCWFIGSLDWSGTAPAHPAPAVSSTLPQEK